MLEKDDESSVEHEGEKTRKRGRLEGSTNARRLVPAVSGHSITVDVKQKKYQHPSMVSSLEDVLKAVNGKSALCPLCDPTVYRPRKAAIVKAHVNREHWHRRAIYEGMSILNCQQVCESSPGAEFSSNPHYHCPVCDKTFNRLTRFKQHLTYHEVIGNRLKKNKISDDEKLSIDVVSSQKATFKAEKTEDHSKSTTVGVALDWNAFHTREVKKEEKKEKQVFTSSSVEVNCSLLELAEGGATEVLEQMQRHLGLSWTIEGDTCTLRGEWNQLDRAREILGNLGSGLSACQSFVEPIVLTSEASPPKLPDQRELDQQKLSRILEGSDEINFELESLDVEIVDDDMINNTILIQQIKDEELSNTSSTVMLKEELDTNGSIDNVQLNNIVDVVEEKPKSVNDCNQSKEAHIPVQYAHRVCPSCYKSFPKRTDLFLHLLTTDCVEKVEVANNPTISRVHEARTRVQERRCPQCFQQFDDLLNAQIHFIDNACGKRRARGIKLIKNDDGVYQCQHCPFTNSVASSVVNHERRKHQERTVPCPNCPKMFVDAKMLKEHFKNVHDPDMTVCHLCGENVAQTKFKRHLSLHQDSDDKKKQSLKTSGNMLFCQQCNFVTKTALLLGKHEQRKHGPRNYQCNICSSSFALEQDLKSHMMIHDDSHNADKLMAKCPHCKKVILLKNLPSHVKLVHMKIKIFECDICLKTFQTKYTLRIHKDTHKPEMERDFKYQCTVCNKRFVNLSIYRDHVNTHTGERPYKCHICSKCFRHNISYLKHKQNHADYGTLQNTNEPSTSVVFMCQCGMHFSEIHEFSQHCQSCSACSTSLAAGMDQEEVMISGEDQPTIIINEDGSFTAIDTPILDVIKNEPCIALAKADTAEFPNLLEGQQTGELFQCGYCQEISSHLEDMQKHILEHLEPS